MECYRGRGFRTSDILYLFFYKKNILWNLRCLRFKEFSKIRRLEVLE